MREVNLGLLDSTAEEPHSKLLRYAITTVVFIAFVALGIWWLLRFHTEKQTVKHFLDALFADRAEEAYRIWKPQSTYGYRDFLDDWGPNGYYGPVKSYRLETAEHPKGGTGVIVVVEVSPYQPFPNDSDALKQSKTKEVRIWVERRDQSLSFPP
jgi:hypothetical protein